MIVIVNQQRKCRESCPKRTLRIEYTQEIRIHTIGTQEGERIRYIQIIPGSSRFRVRASRPNGFQKLGNDPFGRKESYDLSLRLVFMDRVMEIWKGV